MPFPKSSTLRAGKGRDCSTREASVRRGHSGALRVSDIMRDVSAQSSKRVNQMPSTQAPKCARGAAWAADRRCLPGTALIAHAAGAEGRQLMHPPIWAQHPTWGSTPSLYPLSPLTHSETHPRTHMQKPSTPPTPLHPPTPHTLVKSTRYTRAAASTCSGSSSGRLPGMGETGRGERRSARMLTEMERQPTICWQAGKHRHQGLASVS